MLSPATWESRTDQNASTNSEISVFAYFFLTSKIHPIDVEMRDVRLGSESVPPVETGDLTDLFFLD
jgi:hypothetical protein